MILPSKTCARGVTYLFVKTGMQHISNSFTFKKSVLDEYHNLDKLIIYRDMKNSLNRIYLSLSYLNI